MKKYLIAGVVAVVAFAMAGFAASLTVNGGVIQAGSDNTLTCTDAVNVSGYLSESDNGQSYGVSIPTDSFDGCSTDVKVFITAYDGDGNKLANVSSTVADAPSFKWNNNKTVDISKIERVQVILEGAGA